MTEMVTQVGMGKTVTLNGTEEFATVPFHWKIPISPHRTSNGDTISNVEEDVYYERACG